jgi:flagellar protein FlaG
MRQAKVLKQGRRTMQIQPLGGTSSPAFPAPDVIPVAVHAAPAQAQTQAAAPTAQRLEAAVGEANRTMQSIDATLQFEVDPETKMTVIKVVDTDSNTVLRQVPAQEMLEIAQALDRMQGLLLSQKA